MKYRQKQEYLEFAGICRRETEKAILFFDGIREVWLPLSQIIIEREDNTGGGMVISIPEWLADVKEMLK